MCAACADGYSHSGGNAKCEKCPEQRDNVLTSVAGVFAGIAGLFILTNINLSDKGKVDPSDGAKSIGTSFIQVITLLTSYPIAWPDIFVNIFKVGGAVTVLGQHLVNIKCFNPKQSEAAVFYSISILWAAMPFLLPLASTCVWILLSKFKKVDDLHHKIKSTAVGLVYLIWPTLISTTFNLFSCRYVCGKNLLRIDLDEKCWVGRHASYAFGLAMPMLIVYVFGLPLLALINIRRLHNAMRKTKNKIAIAQTAAKKTDDNKNKKGTHHRWFSDANMVEHVSESQKSTHEAFGMLYTSFREECWWWEITVTIRKIMIVGIGVFGEGMGEMQVHVGMAAMLLIIVSTAIVRPYGDRYLLQFLELMALMGIFFTLWVGNVFNAYPRCEDGLGGTIGWCDTISIVIGVVDILILLAVVAAMVYYKKQEKIDQLLKKGICCCSCNNTENQEVGSATAAATTIENPSVNRTVEMTVKTSNTRNKQTPVHGRNITHFPDGWNGHVNEETGDKYYEGPDGSTQWNRPPGNDDRFDRHETKDGEEFFVGPDGKSTWDNPLNKTKQDVLVSGSTTL